MDDGNPRVRVGSGSFGARLAALLLASALMACSPTVDPEASSAPAPEGLGEVVGDVRVPGTPVEEPVGPDVDALDELAGFFGFETSADRLWAEHDEMLRVQEAVQRCMAAQGFEYRINLPPDDWFEIDDRDPVEVAELWGFEVTTTVGAVRPPRYSPMIDPNQELLEAMSPGERAAWLEAAGASGEAIPDDAEQGPHGTGCHNEAGLGVYGDPLDSPDWEVLHSVEDELRRLVQADPRVAGRESEMAVCLAEQGYSDAGRSFVSDKVAELRVRFVELVGDDFLAGPLAAMTPGEREEFLANHSEDEYREYVATWQRERLEGVNRHALEALQAEERAAAVAFRECEQERNRVYREVFAEYERQVIADNWELIQQVRGG